MAARNLNLTFRLMSLLMELGFLQHPHFVGRIDSLKRVYLDDDGRETRCCRLIYRLIAQDLSLYDLAYFKTADSIS